jgi:AbiJ-like protein
MAIFDLYSKRQKQARGEFPDVYQYAELAREFRVQVVHVLTDVFGDPSKSYSETQDWFKQIHDILAREYGVFKLSKNLGDHYPDHRQAVFEFLLGTTTERALDVIELSFQVARYAHNRGPLAHAKPSLTAEQGIEELNERFREHGIGFQFESGELVRVDSQLLHKEAVKPALHVLSDKKYEAANDEFLKAHDHYRHGNHGEAVNECLRRWKAR